MEADEKKCPQCAETVKADATKCRFCGYDFVSDTSAGTTVHPVPPKPRSNLAKGCLIAVAVLVGLIIVGTILGGGEQDGAATKTAQTAALPAMAVTAAEISQAYQTNEAKAQIAYGDKPLKVTGKVKDIDLDFADNPVIKLKGANDQYDMGVNADGKMTDVSISGLPKEAAAEIEKGKTMTFVCQSASEVMGSPQLTDCAVAP